MRFLGVADPDQLGALPGSSSSETSDAPAPRKRAPRKSVRDSDPGEDEDAPQPEVARIRRKVHSAGRDGRVRSKTIAPKRLTRDERRLSELLVYPPDIDRPGPVEYYGGSIRKFGLDIGATGRQSMVWAVFADTYGGRGALAGDGFEPAHCGKPAVRSFAVVYAAGAGFFWAGAGEQHA